MLLFFCAMSHGGPADENPIAGSKSRRAAGKSAPALLLGNTPTPGVEPHRQTNHTLSARRPVGPRRWHQGCRRVSLRTRPGEVSTARAASPPAARCPLAGQFRNQPGSRLALRRPVSAVVRTSPIRDVRGRARRRRSAASDAPRPGPGAGASVAAALTTGVARAGRGPPSAARAPRPPGPHRVLRNLTRIRPGAYAGRRCSSPEGHRESSRARHAVGAATAGREPTERG